MTIHHTDDLRIAELKELSTPAQVIGEFPLSESAEATITRARAAVHRVLDGSDDRLVVVVGPCSIHDTQAALEYAQRLARERDRHADALEIVMRVYFEKPRTTVGWKGLINDLISTAASISTGACALRAACCATSTRSVCPPAANFST